MCVLSVEARAVHTLCKCLTVTLSLVCLYLQCKHVLAVRLAEAIRDIHVKTVNDIEFVDALAAAP